MSRFTPKVVTANDLAEGCVVYLTPEGRWSPWLREAAFPLPADCLRVLAVRAGGAEPDPWEVQAGAVLCDASGPLQLLYVRRVDDPRLFDPLDPPVGPGAQPSPRPLDCPRFEASLCFVLQRCRLS